LIKIFLVLNIVHPEASEGSGCFRLLTHATGKHIDMSHLKQILRLHLQIVPIKKICASTPFARNTVRKYIRYIEQSNRPVDELLDLQDEELYGALFGSEPSSSDRNDSLTTSLS
jgi:hypothetical protein